MSTKKEVKSVCICVEVEKLNNLRNKIAVLEILDNLLVSIDANIEYYQIDANLSREDSDIYARDCDRKAKNYEYVKTLINAIAEKL